MNQDCTPHTLRNHDSHAHAGGCCCFIVPQDVLARFAKDKKLTEAQRESFANALKFDKEWRRVREARSRLALAAMEIPRAAVPAAIPADLLFDCQHGTTLPGVPVASPGSSSDATVKRAFKGEAQVAKFYKQLYGRNSIDNAGMTLISSVHFGLNYNNAFWNGQQMTYGDGDGNIFVDFTRATDVIGHELTHGVTQYSAGFSYSNEPGGLNESMSDVFGSMFRQWLKKETVRKADWLIGKEIMGPGAIAKGYTCLRNMSKPNDTHCMAPQPTKYSQYTPGMDPHYSSGIPNFAFYKAAVAIGGHSWKFAGKIWYAALTGFPPNPSMSMKAFADRTRSLAQSMFANHPNVAAAVDKAWTDVEL